MKQADRTLAPSLQATVEACLADGLRVLTWRADKQTIEQVWVTDGKHLATVSDVLGGPALSTVHAPGECGTGYRFMEGRDFSAEEVRAAMRCIVPSGWPSSEADYIRKWRDLYAFLDYMASRHFPVIYDIQHPIEHYHTHYRHTYRDSAGVEQQMDTVLRWCVVLADSRNHARARQALNTFPSYSAAIAWCAGVFKNNTADSLSSIWQEGLAAEPVYCYSGTMDPFLNARSVAQHHDPRVIDLGNEEANPAPAGGHNTQVS